MFPSNLRLLRAAFLFSLFLILSNCGSAAPPVSIPAPTVANITVTPDGSGSVYVVGEAGAVEGGAEVTIEVQDGTSSIIPWQQILSSTAYASQFCDTAESDGSFACSITADAGDILCIRQTTSAGTSASCGSITVPDDAFAHKLSQIIDVYVDEENNRSYLLGKDLSDQYTLKVFSNTGTSLESTFDLVSIINDSTMELTSATAKDDVILVTDYANNKLHKINRSASALTSSQGSQCTNASLKYVRIDSPGASGADPTDYLLLCAGTDFVELIKYLISTAYPTESDQVSNIDVDSILGLATFGNEGWFVYVGATDGTMELVMFEDTQLINGSTNSVPAQYRAFSAGQVVGASAVKRPLGIRISDSIPGYFDSNFGFNELTLPDSVLAVDIVCGDRSSCTDLYMLGTDGVVYKYSPAQSAAASSSVSTQAIDPARLVIDESAGKLMVIDDAGQAIFWISLSDF
ncbi:MAG: hypothetical protein HYU97_08345 [Deltaproteobacteria bacterium]|nr:hypothetical protein [Deltaproteobacteria bacterium]